MAKKVRSPMHEILSQIDNGTNSANGVLSTLWRVLLKNRRIDGDAWEKLLDAWRATHEEMHGGESTVVKKGNLVKMLASPAMTWKTFIQGLQVLNSINHYKCIRFEIHLVPSKKGVPTEIVGINVVDRTQEIKDKYLVKNSTDGEDATTLVPGTILKQGTIYKAVGFNNRRFNGALLRFIGPLSYVIDKHSFDGCTGIGTLMLTADGMESDEWQIIGALGYGY